MGGTAAIVAGGLFAVQQNQEKQARKDANRIAEENIRAQQKLNNDLINRKKNEESATAAIATRDAARRRFATAAAGATGRRDTILTSPLGLPGGATGGSKTLLGS